MLYIKDGIEKLTVDLKIRKSGILIKHIKITKKVTLTKMLIFLVFIFKVNKVKLLINLSTDSRFIFYA